MNPSVARPLLIVALIAALAALAPFVFARDAVVTTKAGQTFTGELVADNPNEVILNIAGIRTSIARADIEKVELKKTPEEEYAERRAAIADDDYPGRFSLALDLYNKKAYELALRELESIKRSFPDRDMTEVDHLISVTRSQIKLQQQPPAPPQPRPSDNAAARPAANRPGEVPLLTAQQISTIRLWELPPDLAQARPRVTVPSDVIDELFAKYSSDERVPKGRDGQRRFRAQEGWEQLALIFRIQARELYPKVIVHEDPAALIEFRRSINNIYVVRYLREMFEGKVEGLDLKLAARDPNAIPEVYTNFYLLSMARHNGQEFIDRDQPMDSLMIQWGLPRDAAKHPAPEVPNWRPFFRTLDDPKIQTYVAWINSLYKPQPNYGIVYPPPPEQPEGAAPAPANPPQGRGQ